MSEGFLLLQGSREPLTPVPMFAQWRLALVDHLQVGQLAHFQLAPLAYFQAALLLHSQVVSLAYPQLPLLAFQVSPLACLQVPLPVGHAGLHLVRQLLGCFAPLQLALHQVP